MSKLPTLLIKGRLRAPSGDQAEQEELSNWVPMDYIIGWIRRRLESPGIKNRFLVLKSETASGKSVSFPSELYIAFIRGQMNGPGIICTQPRILTTIRNVIEIMKVPKYAQNLQMGVTIGWSTQFNKFRPRRHGLLSATIGTLMHQLRTMTDEEIMQTYRFILIDETHERDLQIDMTIYMLKNFLLRNQGDLRCPFVVLMSATFDPQKFLQYFGCADNFIWCEGRCFPIAENWGWNQDRVLNNYPQAAAEVVERVCRENPADGVNGDILIFMPGMSEINTTAGWLSKVNARLAGDNLSVFSILRIDSLAQRLENADYKNLDLPAECHDLTIGGKKYVPTRRVIITTNVAETGLTLENLKYVIDAGFNREIEFNPIWGIRGLVTKPAPKSRITQRRGRAGRKFPGEFYPLYPKYIYDRLPDQQLPQILLEDISKIFIDIVAEQLKSKMLTGAELEFRVADIDMIDVPSADAIMFCVEKLYTLGFISPPAAKYGASVAGDGAADTDRRYGLTGLGTMSMSMSEISMENIRMILAGYSWGCSITDLITIAAYLTLSDKEVTLSILGDKGQKIKLRTAWIDIYKDAGELAQQSDYYKLQMLICDEFIDGIMLYNAIKRIISGVEPYEVVGALTGYCQRVNIKYDGMVAFLRIRDSIIEKMLIAGFDVFSSGSSDLTLGDGFINTVTRLKYCIYDGYRNNILVRGDTGYITRFGGLPVKTPAIFREDGKELANRAKYGLPKLVLPSYLMYRELSLKLNMNTGMFDVVVDKISSIDSFVNHDSEFAL